MTPGRKLDALVAEKVFGVKAIEPCDECDGSGYIPDTQDRCHICNYSTTHIGFKENYIPRYSTSIKAAWEVVEKLRPDWDIELEILTSRVRCELNGDSSEKFEYVYADTAPHAICLAALKACGVEV